MQKYNNGVPHRDISLFLFGNTVAAEGFSFALGTSSPLSDTVEVVGGGIHQRRLVGEDFGLEVAVVVAVHTHAVALEVGATDIGHRAVENHYLEMYPRTTPPLQPDPQARILVEILAKVLSRFFGMKQPHIDTLFHQFVEHRQKRHQIPCSRLIQILQVGSANPQVVLQL